MSQLSTTTQSNTSHRVRPIPKRQFSLQPESTHPDIPHLSTYPTHPHASSYPNSTSMIHTLPPSRPSAPKRSHSFCGDPSTSNYALASATACSHLSADKTKLVAPPLERTLSSIGFQVNTGQPGTQTIRPISRDPLACFPLSQPISMSMSTSPPSIFLNGCRVRSALPKIVVSSPPTRPGLNPVQRSSRTSKNTSSTSNSTSLRSSRIARSQSLVSNASSRASSYVIATPMGVTTIPPQYDLSVSPPKASFEPGRRNVNLGIGYGLEHGEEEDDDMIVVDDMVERIEELAV